MKRLNRFIATVLCCVLFISNSHLIHATESIKTVNDMKEYSIPIISNEYPNPSVTFYGYNGKYYLSFEDIKDFTRCELSESDSHLTLTHGIRQIIIEKDSGHMIDSDFVDQGIIDILKYDDKYLCEGIPMLVYLGAACTIRDDMALEILMPPITIWESIMPNYLDYYFNIAELYGGEDNVKIALACDIIADVLDSVSGHGLNANADTHLEDALYEILNVDMMKYESVQESVAGLNQNISNFLTSKGVSTLLEAGTSSTDIVGEIIDYYAGFYLDTEILKNEMKWQRVYHAGDFDAASELSIKMNQQVYEQSVIKSDLNISDNIGDILDIGMVALDTAITSYGLMQYDNDTRFLFNRTINEEMFEYTGYRDISWNNISDKISNNLKNNESIVQSVALNNAIDFITEKIAEKGAQTALSGLTSKANIYVSVSQLGSFIASLINYKSNQAFSANMNAIWLSTIQYDIAQMVSRMLIKESNEYYFSDAESLRKLKDMFTLYYRTTIAFSENMAISINEFGEKNRNEWVNYFNATSGKSVSNSVAIYLYRMTNCTIVPIVEYSKLTDLLITDDWIQKHLNISIKDKYTNRELSELISFLLDCHLQEYSESNPDFKELMWFAYSCLGRENKITYEDNWAIISESDVNSILNLYLDINAPQNDIGEIQYMSGKYLYPCIDYGELGWSIAIIDQVEEDQNGDCLIKFYNTYIYPENFETGEINLIDDWKEYCGYTIEQIQENKFSTIIGIGTCKLKQVNGRLVISEFLLSVSDCQYVELSGILSYKGGYIVELNNPLLFYNGESSYTVEEVGITGV